MLEPPFSEADVPRKSATLPCSTTAQHNYTGPSGLGRLVTIINTWTNQGILKGEVSLYR